MLNKKQKSCLEKSGCPAGRKSTTHMVASAPKKYLVQEGNKAKRSKSQFPTDNMRALQSARRMATF